MMCKIDYRVVVRRGPDLFSKDGNWRSSIISEHEIYRVYAIGKNSMYDECEVLIDIEGDGRASWERMAVFEIIENGVPHEWIAQINFSDIGENGDRGMWTMLMGWPEIFRPGHLVGLMNLDRGEIEYFKEIARSYLS